MAKRKQIYMGPMHKYSVGETVEVYQKPRTKEESEGLAKIVKKLDTDDYYDVVFPDDPETSYSRFIF